MPVCVSLPLGESGAQIPTSTMAQGTSGRCQPSAEIPVGAPLTQNHGMLRAVEMLERHENCQLLASLALDKGDGRAFVLFSLEAIAALKASQALVAGGNA